MALLPAVFALVLCGTPSPHVRATVWIRAGNEANGTGWVVDTERRWVVTARHVVADRDSVEVLFLDHPTTDRRHYLSDRSDLQRRGLTATGRVIRRTDNADLALIKLDRLPPGVPALELAAESARSGDVCRSVGHRHDSDLLWTLTAGRVRQVGRLPDGYFWAGHRIGAGAPLVVLQAPITAGESGSAVVNDAGNVVGVVSAVVNQTPGTALAVDVSEVRSLLAQARGETGPRPAESREPSGAPRVAAATVWVRPRATEGRAAGVLIAGDRPLILTSATAVGTEPVVEVVAPRRYLGRIVAEADAYRDLLGLRLSGHLVSGIVLARDPDRDLALIELDSAPPDLCPIALSAGPPRMGDFVGNIGHPTGVDLLWLYAGGTVRAVGPVALARDSAEAPRIPAALLQLPQQEGASGGPVVNAAGELVGIIAARGSARQDLGYAAVPDEIRAFLKAARPMYEPRTAAEWMARGRLAARLGRIATAIESFRKAADLEPDDAAGPAACAAVLAESGRSGEAVRVAEVALKRKPGPAAMAELAAVFVAFGDRARASDLVDGALKLEPGTAPALVVLARLRSGREAVDDVEKAIVIDPTLASAYRVRAGLRDETTIEDRRAAISDWGRVLELIPTDVTALRRRARLWETAKEPKKAVADWSRVTELEPLRAENWIGLAVARSHAGDRTGAAEALRSALRVDSTQTKGVFRVARELARELEADNPADRERVAEWRSTALIRLAAWLPQ